MIPENFCINGDILAVSEERSIKIIRISQIVSIESCKIGSHIFFMNKNESIVCRIPLTAFEEAFAPRGFFRIHDNCVVNTFFVERVDKNQGQEAIMSNGKTYDISRARAPYFEKALLNLFRKLQGATTGYDTKPTGYGTRFTVRGFWPNKVCLALYICRILYDNVPIDTCLF